MAGLDPLRVSEEDALSELYRKSISVLSRLKASAIDPDLGTKKGPTYPITKAAQLVGRTPSAIREAEKDGRLPERERTASGHRVQYSLEELAHMREVFGTRPWRQPDDQPAIISVANFKGGVGKSTVAQHLAQYFAIHGYRVLLIDCDSQASTTLMFGYVPDMDLGEDDTLYGYFHSNDLMGLRSIIRKTHFHGLDLIPANLKLYNLEYEIAGYLAQHGKFDIIDTIAQAIETVVEDYDIVILDPPPALGMVSMAALQAANAMVIPIPPSIVDFASTASFIDMTKKTMDQLEQVGGRSRPAYNFVKLVASRVDENSVTQQNVAMIGKVFGRSLLEAQLRTSAAIGNASSRGRTVYELERPVTAHETHNRCVSFLNSVGYEIEQEVLKTWYSRQK